MIPTFDGVQLFGTTCYVTTDEPRRRRSLETYFGTDGIFMLDGGGSGRISRIVGTLSGFGPTGLATAEAAVRSFKDGQVYTFIDPLGTIWTQVQLETFEPIGRIRQSPTGFLFRGFRCYLRHLV